MNHLGTVPLETRRLLLRRLTENDAKAVYRNWASDSEVTRFMRWNAYKSVRELRNMWLVHLDREKDNPESYEWGIVLKKIGEPIGSISCYKNTRFGGRWEPGYCLGRQFWGRGYATEALTRVMDFMHKEVGIKHYVCLHAKENVASGEVMKRAGFRHVKDDVYHSFDHKRRFECSVYFLDLK